MKIGSCSFFRKYIVVTALLTATQLFAQVEVQANLYEGLENVQSYIKARNHYINQFLKDIKAGKEGLDTSGVKIEGDGYISFTLAQRPDLYDPTSSLYPIRTISSADYPRHEKALLERGFPREDLPVLKSLLERDSEKEIEALNWKFLWMGPLRPLAAKIAAKQGLTNEEVATWLYSGSPYYKKAQIAWTTKFLEQLSVSARRVLISYCSESETSTVFLGGDQGAERISAPDDLVKQFNERVLAMTDEEINMIKTARSDQ